MRQIYNSDVSPCSPLPPSPPPPPPATSERPGREEEVQTCIPGCNQAKLSLSQLLPTRLLNTRMSVSGSHLPCSCVFTVFFPLVLRVHVPLPSVTSHFLLSSLSMSVFPKFVFLSFFTVTVSYFLGFPHSPRLLNRA